MTRSLWKVAIVTGAATSIGAGIAKEKGSAVPTSAELCE